MGERTRLGPQPAWCPHALSALAALLLGRWFRKSRAQVADGKRPLPWLPGLACSFRKRFSLLFPTLKAGANLDRDSPEPRVEGSLATDVRVLPGAYN